MHSAIVAGHICVDLVPRFDGEVQLQPGALVGVGPLDIIPGGCVANTGRALAELGAPVRLVADVGADALGELLRQVIGGMDNVEHDIARAEDQRTSYSIVVESPGADRTFWHHVGANAAFDGDRIDFGAGDLFHLGYPPLLPSLLSDRAQPLRRVLDRARKRGFTTSMDLCVSPPDLAVDWPTFFAQTMPLVDIATPSLDDLASTVGVSGETTDAQLRSAAEMLLSYGAGVVMVTGGSAGLLIRTAGPERLTRGGRALRSVAERWAHRDLLVRPPSGSAVSTTGAGDAAAAGLLYGLLAGLPPECAAQVASGAAAHRVSGALRLPTFDAGGYLPAGTVL